MDTNELIKLLGDAAATAKPPQEYCLLWIDSWATCMTKAEWSGWMQAIGAFIALCVAVGVPYLQERFREAADFKQARNCLIALCGLIDVMREQVKSNPDGPQSAVVAAQEAAKNVLLRFRHVRLPNLSLEQTVHWINAQTTAEQLIDFISRVFENKVDEPNIPRVLEILMSSSKEHFFGFGTKPGEDEGG